MRTALLSAWASVLMIGGAGLAAGQALQDEVLAKVTAALPGQPYARPAQPRKLLIFTLCRGFPHSVIPLASEALKQMGAKTGAYQAVVSSNAAFFEPDQIGQFDAILLNNTTGELFLPPDFEQRPATEQTLATLREKRLRQSLLRFVQGGKGLVGVHAATDCFYKWPAYGEMMGGYFAGHPWNEEVVVKLDEPGHPLTAMFGGQPLVVADEIYQFKEPYSRERLRVLLSLDTSRTDMKKPGIIRTDGDFAVSWIRPYGQGRVFYCSLGHRDEIFWNPKVLQHYLAGIQFALGDLKADAAPLAKPAAAPPK